MELTKLSAIIVPAHRQREQFDVKHIEELAASIAALGLLHAPVVRDDGYTLIAGECRVKAMTLLHERGVPFFYSHVQVPADAIPVHRASSLSPDALEEAELDENIKRRDLTWRERANAIARLHTLRGKQATASGGTQSLKDTATELKGAPAQGAEITEIREAQLLQSFENDPDVAKAKSRPEALNIVKKKMLAEFTAELAKQYTTENADNCPHTLLMGSCVDFLAAMDPGQFDVIISDPPYGIDAHKMAPLSGSVAGTQHAYEDTYDNAHATWCATLFNGYKAAKPDAALYMFCDFKYFSEITDLAVLAGWTVWDRPIIWHKPGGGMLGDIQHGPRRSYETILFAYKGDKRTLGAFNDVIVMNGGDSLLHAAAKPPALYVELLKRSTVPGMAVLDTCAGSGPIFVAANQLNLIATAMEISPAHAETALSRINDKD